MLKIRLIKDRIARHLMLGLTVFGLLILFIIGAVLLIKSLPVINQYHFGDLLGNSSWRPFKGEFGFFSFILSTLYVTLIAIVLAFPLSLLASIYLSEYATARLQKFFSPVVDLLSGIPPVIYGVWGTLTIVPLISETLAPHFVDFSTGYSVLAGGVVLAIMIIPLIISILTEVFNAIPRETREASLSLGATK